MLTEGDEAGKAVYAVRQAPALRDAIQAMIPALEAAKAQITREEFASIMVKQRVLFGLGDREVGEWSMILEGFFEVLGEFSAAQIEEAFRRWHKGEGLSNPQMASLFPQPRQLYPLAHAAKSEIWIAAYRAKKALEGDEGTHRAVSEGDYDSVKDGFRELLDGFKAKSIPDEMRPTRSPAEVSAELRMMATEPVNKPDEEIVL